MDIELLLLLSEHVSNRYFLDVGAEKGSIAKALYERGFSGDLIDPLPKHGPILARLAEQFAGRFYPFALADSAGVRPFYIAQDLEGRELDYFHSLQPIKPQTEFIHQRAINVECHRVDQLVRSGLLPEEIGIFKTDTEGNDFYVLEGLGDMRPELIMCEFFQEDVYSGWTQGRAEVLVGQMRALGYEHYFAIKRFSCWTSMVYGLQSFKSNEWGNLFFLDRKLFDRTKANVVAFMGKHDQLEFMKIQAMHGDLEQKEQVIQQLIANEKSIIYPNFIKNFFSFGWLK